MKKKNTLYVKSLRRYITLLLTVGILQGISCSPEKKSADNQSAEVLQFENLNIPYILPTEKDEMTTQDDSLVNPFLFEHLTHPYSLGFCNLGSPKTLVPDEARSVIEKVFEEEGIHLEKEYHYKKDDISVVLSGFDTNLNIGYLWLNHSMDGKRIHPYMGYYDHVIYNSFLKQKLDSKYKVDQANELRNKIKGMVDRNEKHAEMFRQHFELTSEWDYEDDNEKLREYKHRYQQILIKKHQDNEKKPSVQFFNEYFNDWNISPEDQKQVNAALISNTERAMNTLSEKEVLTEILDDIIRIESEVEKRNHYNNFVVFIVFSHSNELKRSEDNPAEKILAIKDKKILAKEIQALGFEHLDKILSLQEARSLDNIHQTKKDFIAPISIADRRFQYHHQLNSEEKEEAKKLEAIRDNFTEEEYSQAWGEIVKDMPERNKNKTLKALETQVRQYIQWAKQQGAY